MKAEGICFKCDIKTDQLYNYLVRSWEEKEEDKYEKYCLPCYIIEIVTKKIVIGKHGSLEEYKEEW